MLGTTKHAGKMSECLKLQREGEKKQVVLREARGQQQHGRCNSPTIPTRGLLLLLFPTFSELVANLKNILDTLADPARGLLNREK